MASTAVLGRTLMFIPVSIVAGSAMKFPLKAVRSSVSPTDCVSQLADVLNAVMQIPPSERTAWLAQNVHDPEDRQAVATLLLAYDGDGFLDVDTD